MRWGSGYGPAKGGRPWAGSSDLGGGEQGAVGLLAEFCPHVTSSNRAGSLLSFMAAKAKVLLGFS